MGASEVQTLDDILSPGETLSDRFHLRLFDDYILHHPNITGTVVSLLTYKEKFASVADELGVKITQLNPDFAFRYISMLGVTTAVLLRLGDEVFHMTENEENKRRIALRYIFSDPKTWGLIGGFAHHMTDHPYFDLESLLVGFGTYLATRGVKELIEGKEEFINYVKETFNPLEIINKSFDVMARHPILTGSAGIGAFLLKVPVEGRYMINEMLFADNYFPLVLFPWYYAYAPFAILRDYHVYPENRQTLERPPDLNIFQKGLYSVLDNVDISSLVLGTSVGAAFGMSGGDHASEKLALSVVFGNMASLVTKILLTQVKNNKILDISYEKQRELYQDKMPEQKRNIADWIFDNPGKVGLFATLLHYTYELVHMIPAQNMNYDAATLSLSAISSIFWGGAAATLDVLAGGLFHTRSRHLIKNSALSYANSLFGRYGKAIEYWKEVMQVPSSTESLIKRRIREFDLYHKAGSPFEELIDHMLFTLRLTEQKDSFVNNYDIAKRITGVGKLGSFLTKERMLLKGDVRSYLILALYKQLEGDVEGATQIWEQIINSHPEEVVFKGLYAEQLSSVGELDKSTEVAHQFFEQILDNPELVAQMRRLSSDYTTHEVLELPVVKNMLVAKFDSRQEPLYGGYVTENFLYWVQLKHALENGLDHDFISSTKPFAFLWKEEYGKYCEGLRRENLPSLDNVPVKEYRADLGNVIRNTMKIMGLATRELEQTDFNSFVETPEGVVALDLDKYVRLPEIRRRLINRLGENEYLGRFLAPYTRYLKNLNMDWRFALHSDLYKTNILKGGFIIDPRALRIGENPVTDLGLVFADPVLAAQRNEQTVNLIADSLEEFYERPESIQQLTDVFLGEILYSSINLMGSRANQGKISEARQLCAQAMNLLPKGLKYRFKDYVAHSNAGILN